MINYHNMAFIFLVALIILVLQGCESGVEDKREKAGSHPILDSKFGASDKQVYWLDEDRVIFYGYEGPKPKNEEELGKLKYAIYIWDTKNNQVRKYDNGAGLCYQDGYIYYSFPQDYVKDPSKKHSESWKEGLFGNEVAYIKQYNAEEGKDWYKNYERSEISCKVSKRPATMQGRYWFPLLEGDGYLDGGKDNTIHPSEWEKTKYIRGDGVEISLPIKFAEDYNEVSYVTHAKAYLLQKTSWNSYWIKNRCIPVWWLANNGDVKNQCVHINKISNDILRWLELSRGMGSVIYPTVNGYFLVFKNNRWAGYLISGAGTEVVKYGYIEGVSVSPNGCKIAFSYAKDWEAMRVGGEGQRTVVATNLCN